MRTVLLILLACIAASSLCLSACFAPVQGGAGGETYGLAFNEGYLDVIELGELVEKCVFEKFGVKLEREVKYIV